MQSWVLGLPLQCNEFNEITNEHLESLVYSSGVTLTGVGTDPLTGMKGFHFSGVISPGTPLSYALCLENVSIALKTGEYAVSGYDLRVNQTFYANDGRIDVPDLCVCDQNTMIPTNVPSDIPTINPTVSTMIPSYVCVSVWPYLWVCV